MVSLEFTFTANPRPLQITLYVFMSSMNQDQELTMNCSIRSRPAAGCGSGYELLIAKFRLKLKKVGKTSRPFRCDLNKIPCDYTVEVTNRFKGLNLIEFLKNYGLRFVTLYGGSDQDHPHEGMQKGKCLPEDALQMAEKR